MSRLYLSNPCAFFATHCTRCCGRSQRPASPRPLRFRGATRLQELGRKQAAGILAVVPAKAGTHTPRRKLFGAMVVGFRSTIAGGGYGPRPAPGRPRGEDVRKRTPFLTIFWHCGHWHFSSRTAQRGVRGNEPSTVLADSSPIVGLGNADSRRKWWNSGWGGRAIEPVASESNYRLWSKIGH